MKSWCAFAGRSRPRVETHALLLVCTMWDLVQGLAILGVRRRCCATYIVEYIVSPIVYCQVQVMSL